MTQPPTIVNPLSPSPIYDVARPAGFATLGAMRWNHTSDPMFLEQLIFDNNIGLTTWRRVLIYPDDLPPMPLPPPTITELFPTSAVIGSGDMQLYVMGTGFTPNSIVVLDGVEQPTSFIDIQDLIILLKPSLETVPRDVLVTVRRVADAQESAPATFTFLAA